MASFDIASLFTNIPVDQTIEIISNHLFANSMYFEGFDRSQLIKLLSLSVKGCLSMINHGYTTALSLSNQDVMLMNVFFSSDPRTMCLFLSYLNCQHPNIFFSSELEKNGKLPFLDIEITRSNGKFSTSVYRKPTFTGLFTNFHSFVPLVYKRSFVCCLLHQIFHLCSSHENIHAQLEVVRKLFNLNGFPIHMFDQLVHHFLNNIFEPKPPPLSVLKKIVYFCLPSGSHSLQIRTQISGLCSAAYPNLNVRFVFCSSTCLCSFFPFKDKVPKFLRSGVVYLFKCRCCSASYVGQTTCHLHIRVSEHLGIPPITGKPSSNPPMSSIFSHLKTTGHTDSFDDFQILSSCSDDCEIMIHESLLISKLKPVQGNSIPLNLL